MASGEHTWPVALNVVASARSKGMPLAYDQAGCARTRLSRDGGVVRLRHSLAACVSALDEQLPLVGQAVKVLSFIWRGCV